MSNPTHHDVRLPSGRIVKARVIQWNDGLDPLVSWCGMPPFHAIALTHEDILKIEAEAEKST